MGAIDIAGIAANATDIAWELAANALRACTLQMGPSGTYDVATDAQTLTWAHAVSLNALIYGEGKMEDQPAKVSDLTEAHSIKAKAIVRASDLPDGAEPDTRSRLIDGSKTWDVIEAQKIPTDPIYLLTLSR